MALLLAVVSLQAPVAAHADLEPREAVVDRRTILTLVVPAEVGPIEEVRMRPPSAFLVDFVEAKPGWNLSAERFGDRITEARWKASTPVPPGQFVEFRFRALAPAAAGTHTWSVEEHLARVEASAREEAERHVEETRREGAHTHGAEGNVRRWEPVVAATARDKLDGTVAELNTTRTAIIQLQQSFSQVSTGNAQVQQAAQSATTAAYAGIGLGVAALLVAAVSVLWRKQ